MHGVSAESIRGEETALWELVPLAPGRAGHGPYLSVPPDATEETVGASYRDGCHSLRGKALRTWAHGGSGLAVTRKSPWGLASVCLNGPDVPMLLDRSLVAPPYLTLGRTL